MNREAIEGAPRFRLLVLFAVLVLSLAAAAYTLIGKALERETTDFAVYLEASHAMHAGEQVYNRIFDREISRRIGEPQNRDGTFRMYFLYPPQVTYAIYPLTQFSYRTAQIFWQLLIFASFLGCVYLVSVRLSPDRAPAENKLAVLTAVLLALLVFSPVFMNFYEGQANIPALFAALLSLHLLEKERNSGAGAVLAFGALVKVTPAVFLLPELVRRNTRALAGFVAAALIFTGAVLICGMDWELIPGYLRAIFSHSEYFARLHGNYAVDRVFYLLLDEHQSKIFGMVFKVLAGGLLAAAVLFGGSRPRMQTWSLIVLAFLMIAPELLSHHLIWLILPCMYLLETKARRWPVAMVIAISASSMTPWMYFAAAPGGIFGQLVCLLPLVLLLTSYGFVLSKK